MLLNQSVVLYWAFGCDVVVLQTFPEYRALALAVVCFCWHLLCYALKQITRLTVPEEGCTWLKKGEN